MRTPVNRVWSYGFVEDRTHDGRKHRMLNVVDEFTRECIMIRIARRLRGRSRDRRMVRSVHHARRPGARSIRQHSQVIAKVVQERIAAVGAKTAYIAPGSPRENGYIEYFNARLRDELLDGEIFYTLKEVKIVIERW